MQGWLKNILYNFALKASCGNNEWRLVKIRPHIKYFFGTGNTQLQANIFTHIIIYKHFSINQGIINLRYGST